MKGGLLKGGAPISHIITKRDFHPTNQKLKIIKKAMKDNKCFKDNIILPHGSREMLRVLKGMEVNAFLTIMDKLMPLTREFVKGRGRSFIDLSGKLGADGMYSLFIPMREFSVRCNHYERLRESLRNICDIMGEDTLGNMMVVDYGRQGKDRVAVVRVSEAGLRLLLDAEHGFVELPSGMLKSMPEPWLLKLYLELYPWCHLLYRQFPLHEFAEWIFPHCEEDGKHNLSRFKKRLRNGLAKLDGCLPADSPLRGVTFDSVQSFGQEEVVKFRFKKNEKTLSGEKDYEEEAFRHDMRVARERLTRTMRLTSPQADKLLARLDREGMPLFMTTLNDVCNRICSGKVYNPTAYALRCMTGCLRLIEKRGKEVSQNASEDGILPKSVSTLPKIDIDTSQECIDTSQECIDSSQECIDTSRKCIEKMT